MRLTLAALAAAMLLAALATMMPGMRTEAHNGGPECGAAACTDAGRASVRGHDVFSGACAVGDLHVMRYTPDAASGMLVATWCE
jgi:type IV secretory pathway TrbL component